MKFGIGNTEEVERSDDLLGGNAHETDSGGVAANLGGPEAEKLLILLHTFSLHGRGRPVKVHHAVKLHGGLVEEVHPGKLVHRDGCSLVQSGDVLVIGRPLERRPGELGGLLGLTIGSGGCVLLGKRTDGLAGLDVPDHIVLSIIVDRQLGVALIRNGNRPVGPRNQVVFVGREGNEVNEGMGKTPDSRPGGTTPELNTLLVN